MDANTKGVQGKSNTGVNGNTSSSMINLGDMFIVMILLWNFFRLYYSSFE